MTQQPPPQSPTPPEGVSEPTSAGHPAPTSADHTAPLGYDQTQAQPVWYREAQPQPPYPAYPPVPPQSPAEPGSPAWTQTGAEPAQPAAPRRLAELFTAAVLAAVLASAGTYAVTRGDDTAAPFAQTRASGSTQASPVVQANPNAPNWTVTAAAVSPSVVAISVQSGQGSGQGSGVIFDTDNHILTNNHVVAAGGEGSVLSVTLNDLRTFGATVVGTDPSTDLAVIKLTNGPKDLKALALGDSNTLKVGDPAMAVGNPLGLAGTVTTGIVSALNRPVTTSPQQTQGGFGQQPAGEPVVTNAVQTSAAINPGNSGGALVNGNGQLIGINSSIASLGSVGNSAQGGNIGIGFAIPVNEARSIADQLITSGKATHAYLGVSSRDAEVPVGSAKRAAAVLTAVNPGTPAAKAGVQAGDAILAIDGDPIDGPLALVAQVRERTAGEKVTIKIVRNGQIKDISVTLASKPTTNP